MGLSVKRRATRRAACSGLPTPARQGGAVRQDELSRERAEATSRFAIAQAQEGAEGAARGVILPSHVLREGAMPFLKKTTHSFDILLGSPGKGCHTAEGKLVLRPR